MKWPGSGDSYMVGFEVATHAGFWMAAEDLLWKEMIATHEGADRDYCPEGTWL